MQEDKAWYEETLVFFAGNMKTHEAANTCSENLRGVLFSWRVPLNPLISFSLVSFLTCRFMGIPPFSDRPYSTLKWNSAFVQVVNMFDTGLVHPDAQGDESFAWRCCLGGCGKSAMSVDHLPVDTCGFARLFAWFISKICIYVILGTNDCWIILDYSYCLILFP